MIAKCGVQQRRKEARTKNAVLMARPSSRKRREEELPFELRLRGFLATVTTTPVAVGGPVGSTDPAIGVFEKGFM
jgi:hypothetical protein